MTHANTFPAPDATNSEISEDALLGGRVRLLQPRDGYRVAIDPVLLAAAVPARPSQRVLDVGTGVGAAALCLAARISGLAVDGLEIQPALVRLGERNVELNERKGEIRLFAGGITTPPAEIADRPYDHVMANPPYLPADHGHPPHNASKAAAVQESGADLAAWLSFLIGAARRKGTVTLIHRADRLDELLALMHGHLGRITVFPLWPTASDGVAPKSARRVLVQGRKGISGPLDLRPGMVLHEPDGRFTRSTQAVLRDGAALVL
jgi:tRNA1(Val) A37 N6-methylase TrmN6